MDVLAGFCIICATDAEISQASVASGRGHREIWMKQYCASMSRGRLGAICKDLGFAKALAAVLFGDGVGDIAASALQQIMDGKIELRLCK